MKSIVAKRILSETSNETKQKAVEYGNSLFQKEWISFKDKLPKKGQFIWLKQEDYTERAIFREDGVLELILPQYKVNSIITAPTHWKDDTY